MNTLLEPNTPFSDRPGPIILSTLAEAEYFADAGYTDILYAVGFAPHKLERVLALHRRGIELTVLLDSIEQARAVADASSVAGIRIPALIEVDCDGHRGGIAPDDPTLIEIGRALTAGGAELRGVLAHAGESYSTITHTTRQQAAENERETVVHAASRLREAGRSCPMVSVGSTPTAGGWRLRVIAAPTRKPSIRGTDWWPTSPAVPPRTRHDLGEPGTRHSRSSTRQQRDASCSSDRHTPANPAQPRLRDRGTARGPRHNGWDA